MKLKTLLIGVAVGTLLISGCGNTPGQAEKAVVKIAEYSDPLYEALLYPVMNGLVEHPDVKLSIDLLPVPGLVQAVSSQQYDLVQSAAIAVPLIAQGGVELKIVKPDLELINGAANYGIVTKADSSIKSLEDLKGKKLAVESVAATNTLQMRLAIAKSSGLNVSVDKGDITFIETPAAQMRQLLDAGTVDAVYLYQSALFAIKDDPNYRSVANPQNLYGEEFGTRILLSTLVAQKSTLDVKGKEIKAAVELLEDSIEYTLAHKDEIFPKVAESRKISADYLPWAMQYQQAYPKMTPDELKNALSTLYTEAEKIGALKKAPDVANFLTAYEG